MTGYERNHHEASMAAAASVCPRLRHQRAGSQQLLRQYAQMKKMFKQMGKPASRGAWRG